MTELSGLKVEIVPLRTAEDKRLFGLAVESSQDRQNKPDPQRVANFLEGVRIWLEQNERLFSLKE